MLSFILTLLSPASHRNSSSRERGDNFDRSNRGERFDRGEDRRDERDRNRLLVTKRSFSREKEERSREREQRAAADPVRRVASMTDDRDRARSREKNGGWQSIQCVILQNRTNVGQNLKLCFKFTCKKEGLLSVFFFLNSETGNTHHPPTPTDSQQALLDRG